MQCLDFTKLFPTGFIPDVHVARVAVVAFAGISGLELSCVTSGELVVVKLPGGVSLPCEHGNIAINRETKHHF